MQNPPKQSTVVKTVAVFLLGLNLGIKPAAEFGSTTTYKRDTLLAVTSASLALIASSFQRVNKGGSL